MLIVGIIYVIIVIFVFVIRITREADNERGREMSKAKQEKEFNELMREFGDDSDVCPNSARIKNFHKGDDLGRELSHTYSRHKKDGSIKTVLVYKHKYYCSNCDLGWSVEEKEEDPEDEIDLR